MTILQWLGCKKKICERGRKTKEKRKRKVSEWENVERSEKWGEKNSSQQFPQWVLWQPGHLDSQGSPWAPYVHHETPGRTVHVGPRLFTTHTLPDTQATNVDTQKHTVTHTITRHTSNTGHTLPRHKCKNAYINKHEFMWPNTHASTLASTGELGRERERDGGRARV